MPPRPKAPAKDTTPTPGPQRVWDGVIAIAGAATGLTALLYVIGAVTMWARLRAAGLPTDVALEHEPRAQVLAIGARGAVAILAAVAVTFLLAYLVLLAATYAASLVSDSETIAKARDASVLDAGAISARGLDIHTYRALGALAVGPMVWASFEDWRTFAVAIAVVTAGAGVLRYLHERPDRKRPSLGLLLGVLAGAAVAAVAWQIQPPVLIQTVVVTPVGDATLADVGLEDETAGVALPYFGESGQHVYVAEINSVARTATGRYSWTFSRRILEIPRKDVRLTFEAVKGELKPELPAPADSLWGAAKRAFAEDDDKSQRE